MMGDGDGGNDVNLKRQVVVAATKSAKKKKTQLGNNNPNKNIVNLLDESSTDLIVRSLIPSIIFAMPFASFYLIESQIPTFKAGRHP